MDRNIPHIRDIFSSSRKKSGEFQDLCVYDKSPRSRRRGKPFETSPEFDHSDIKATSPRKRSEKGKENQKSKSSDEARLLPENHNKSSNNNNNSAYGSKPYSSKTLTERDIRHLERHLSMKKTIRKQISRNLAQAFVDNPNLFEPDPKPSKDYGATISKAKLAKSEQNVLDMLKISIDDRDSGHSSPTNEVLARDDDDDEDCDGNYEGLAEPKSWSNGHRNSETKLLNSEVNHKNCDKKSIWKMFSTRNKGKR